MRGTDDNQGAMFSYVSLERRVPKDHPLRAMRDITDAALADLSPLFDRIYSNAGRPSIPPEQLLRALILQVLYSVRSERMLVEQLDYNLLFRWFVGLSMDDIVWDATTFTKNRDRLLEGAVAEAFFDRIVEAARKRGLLSREHFSVDGTLIKAWASQKSLRPKDDGDGPPSDDGGSNPTVDFRGERRSNATHESKTDPEARLVGRRGKETTLAYQGHVLMENRNGLVVGATLTQASGHAERDAALELLSKVPGGHRITLGADRGYDTRAFVAALRERAITPHVAQNTSRRRSAIDGRTTKSDGYTLSQKVRKRIEEVFGWMKTCGPVRQTKFRGRDRVGWSFHLTAAVYNMVRMRNLACVT